MNLYFLTERFSIPKYLYVHQSTGFVLKINAQILQFYTKIIWLSTIKTIILFQINQVEGNKNKIKLCIAKRKTGPLKVWLLLCSFYVSCWNHEKQLKQKKKRILQKTHTVLKYKKIKKLNRQKSLADFVYTIKFFSQQIWSNLSR